MRALTPPAPRGLRTAYNSTLGRGEIGEVVSICGWVASRREHGEHLVFIDVRDHTGIVQCVTDQSVQLRSEYVVRVTGTVKARREGTVNENIASGEIELQDCVIETLSTAEPPPIPLDGRSEADEAMRLRYRYLDLRTERMQSNLRIRARVFSVIRASMDRQGFTEVETPLLWTPTPEGAREFAIPSRLQHGSFYVLPQSPQIAKQLTMVGGIDRYYQIARCMRDEDQRADRQFEFTQLDVEASFVQEEDIRSFVSEAIGDAVEAVTGDRPEEFKEMTYSTAMARYGSDKPDLRIEETIVDVSELFADSKFNALRAAVVNGLCLKGQGGLGRARLDALVDLAKSLGAKGLVWMRATEEDGEIGLESPISKFLSPDELSGLITRLSVHAGSLVLLVADERRVTETVLGQLRIELCRPGLREGARRFVWVTDFPLFEGVEANGQLIAAHHAFTMPKLEDLELLSSDPLKVRAQSYDLVLNGWELGSGSIRIHRSDIQQRVFESIGLSDDEIETRFGFLLGALKFGAPPHGGFAVGLDRLVALLAGEDNIREVIAFPKTQSGSDLMTGAPRPLSTDQLADLGIRVTDAGKPSTSTG